MGLATKQFNLIELKSKAGKDYYIEGFISTSDPDSFKDIVTKNAQQSMTNDIINTNITMDEDHDSHRDKKTGEMFSRIQNKIPLAKIESAELREIDDSIGTWVRVKLNNDYPLFKEILNSIKNGFLHSFSIAYDTIKEKSMKIGDQIFNVIDDLKILNVGITGVPVNTNAKFQLALKSFSKMEEKIKIEEMQKQISTIQAENVKLKSVAGKEEKEMIELKSQVESVDERLSNENKTLKGEITELKSLLEKVRATPVNSAQMKSNVTESQKQSGNISFTNLM